MNFKFPLDWYNVLLFIFLKSNLYYKQVYNTNIRIINGG